MFTTIYQQPKDIHLDQTERVKIIKPDFEIGYDIPENIFFYDHGFDIFVHDKNGESNVLLFNLIDFKTTPAKYAKKHTDYYTPEKIGHILEIENSKLISDMKQKVNDDQMVDVLNKAKHYVLPLKENLIEIVALDINVEKGEDPKLFSKYSLDTHSHGIKKINWSLFKGPEVVFKDHHIRDAIEVNTSDFETCTTPLEEFKFSGDNLIMYLDDKNYVRHKITFRNCKKIGLTTVDCANHLTNYYYGFETYRHILNDEKSDVIKQLKKYATDSSEFEKLQNVKHFALPLQDNLIEIIAEDISVEKA